MSRTIERSVARREYEKFSKRWRDEKRMAGLYGKTGYRKPTFSEWNAIHQRDLEQLKQSTPADVVEHLGVDPWEGQSEFRPAVEQPKEERGVVTLNIAGNEDE